MNYQGEAKKNVITAFITHEMFLKKPHIKLVDEVSLLDAA